MNCRKPLDSNPIAINYYYYKDAFDLLISEPDPFLMGYELDFFIDIGITLLAEFIMGAERVQRQTCRDKPTHWL